VRYHKSYVGEKKEWVKFPWNPERKKVDIATLANVLIAFRDDNRSVNIPKDYFPAEEVQKVVEELKELQDLSIVNQLENLQCKPGEIWPGLYSLALAWREIARGKDPQLGVKLTDEERESLIMKLPAFPKKEFKGPTNEEARISDTVGDYYHFFTQLVRKFAEDVYIEQLKKSGKYDIQHKAKKGLLDFEFWVAPIGTKFLRGSKLGSGTHNYAEKLGIEIGAAMAKVAMGQSE
jgi:hypothetical protein